MNMIMKCSRCVLLKWWCESLDGGSNAVNGVRVCGEGMKETCVMDGLCEC